MCLVLKFGTKFSFSHTMGQGASLAYERVPDAPPISNTVIDVATMRYAKPWFRDMAIGFVFFNPGKSKRMLMNYLYTVEKLKLAGIPYYTIELCFKKEDPEIKDAFHVRARTVLFHKEKLCSILEQKIPWYYRKIMFMDADLVFGNADWYTQTSALLERHDVVQPFSSAVWMDLTYKTATQERLSVFYMNRTEKYNWRYHPGFAWAFRRSWFRTHKFYEYSITGSGDTLSAAAWLGVITDVHPAFRTTYATYCAQSRPRLACTSGKVYHLYHGTHANRKYVSRHAILDGVRDVQTLLRPNWDSVWELSDKRVEPLLLTYFLERQDDSL